ncbi:helix-turn-helix transcriptional regulator [Deferribacter autotrophicus]|uniref:Helix-turn-helix transcriptional regulator n=1 Tax=Deferribacter autotrophicus TaxID=500465 RepID=A0A5A8F5Q2_9BACT|nr:helix-turn-helix transcriptional regulator [Deferribacter autotrophicus]KAA0257187.1 helix-turn-helix transcriptional regulator [Deferribacter autotrophicus]
MRANKLPFIDKKNYIKALLVAKGIKLTDIAKELNVALPTVSQVISGKKTSFRIQKAISEALSVPYEDLWGDTYRIVKTEGKSNVK